MLVLKLCMVVLVLLLVLVMRRDLLLRMSCSSSCATMANRAGRLQRHIHMMMIMMRRAETEDVMRKRSPQHELSRRARIRNTMMVLCPCRALHDLVEPNSSSSSAGSGGPLMYTHGASQILAPTVTHE
jgi:hypothetical protein